MPTPLKFLGRIVGTPGELTTRRTSSATTRRSRQGVADAREFWKIGKTEEGRDMVALAIADEATIAALDEYKGMLERADRSAQDDRSERRACSPRAKPIY